MPAQRDDTASVAALLVFVLLGLTGLAGTPKPGTAFELPVFAAVQEEVVTCPWFHR